MKKTKPIIARTPAELACILGLPPSIARQWEQEHTKRKRSGSKKRLTRARKKT
jgi:hypothetical protein